MKANLNHENSGRLMQTLVACLLALCPHVVGEVNNQARSPSLNVPMEVRQAARELEQALTPEKLRALPDDSPVLRELFRGRISLSEARVEGIPMYDMIEREMWRRGDVTVNMVMDMLVNPSSKDSHINVALWLKYRPWMKPWEFLPLARQVFQEKNTYPYSKEKHDEIVAALFMAEFLADWGEEQDASIVFSEFVKQTATPDKQESMKKRFKERLELRRRGTPHALPDWFSDPAEAKYLPSPIPDRTKTYAEMKAQVIRTETAQPAPSPPAVEVTAPAVPGVPAPTIPANQSPEHVENPSEGSSRENHGPPWIMLGSAVAVLLALLTLQARLRR